MNLKYITSLLLIAATVVSCKHHTDPKVSEELHQLLKQKNYFKLDERFKAVGSNADEGERLYFKAFIDNAFNRNSACIADVDSVFSNKHLKLSDSAKYDLRHVQADSYFKIFQYAKAAKCDSDILKDYKRILNKDAADDINNDLLMRNALKTTAPQKTTITSNTTIAWKKDNLGLIEIPINTNAHTFDAIFDTRANISSITQTYAKKLGLRMLDVSYNEGSGATGAVFKTGMGIADSLQIGDIQLKNVVFQVMPDSILYIAPVRFQLNIIIGFPVIEQLGEVHIYKKGTMMIPVTPAHNGLHNFVLDGLDPVLALKVGKDTLPFLFDSGATSSTFYVAYFNRYKNEVIKTGKKKMMGFGGAGGSQKKEVYVLPKTLLSLGNKTVAIDSIAVLTKPIAPGEVFYGNIGQDFIRQFDEVIYNFRDMYIDGVKK